MFRKMIIPIIGIALAGAFALVLTACDDGGTKDTRTPPTEPLNFEAVAGNAEVELSWDEPLDNGGAEVTGYQVASSKDDFVWVNVDGTSTIIDGLTNFTTYTFRVRAVNAKGAGNYAETTAMPIAFELHITGWIYNDPPNTPSVTVDGEPYDGTLSFSYSATEDGEYTATVPTNAGTWWVKTTIPESAEYPATTIKTSFTVAKAQVAKPTLAEDYDFTYNGSNHSVALNTAGVYTLTGNTQANAGNYNATVTLDDTANYEWADGTTAPLSLAWSIKKAEVVKPTLTGTTTFEYDATDKTVTVSSYNAELIEVTGDLTGKNAGIYTVIVSLKQPNNYSWTGTDGNSNSFNLTWEIEGIKVTKPTITGTYTYTGGSLTVAFTNESSFVTISGERSRTNAGDYTFTVSLNEPESCQWADTGDSGNFNLTWTIAKATVAKPALASNSLTYNGTPQSVSLSTTGVYTLSNNTATNAGNYNATVTLNDTANYQWNDNTTAPFTLAWSIAKATIAKPALASNSLTYNGTEQSVSLSTSGLYTLTNNTGTDAVNYTATVTLTDTANYQWNDNTIAPFTLSWSISPMQITITPTASQTVGYGSTDIAYTHTPLLGTDSITGSLAHTTANGNSFNGSNAKTETITIGSLSASSNYSLTLSGSVSVNVIPFSFIALNVSEWFVAVARGITLSGEVTIPSTYLNIAVTRLNENAFRHNHINNDNSSTIGITKVTIPSSITYISNSSFNGCTNLESIVMHDNITGIGNYAFSGCSSLTNIIMPNSLSTIGISAFENCTGLTELTIPSLVATISGYAFLGCTNLTKVTFERNNNTTIYAQAFLGNLITLTGGTTANRYGTWTTTAPVGSTSTWVKQEE